MKHARSDLRIIYSSLVVTFVIYTLSLLYWRGALSEWRQHYLLFCLTYIALLIVGVATEAISKRFCRDRAG